MKGSNRMSVEEYRREILGIHNTGKAGAVHKGNQEATFEQAYHAAAEALSHLQGTDGALFLGRTLFDLRIEIHGETQADGANVYKGIEDALNRIAWFDDKQNVHFRADKFCESEGTL